MKLHIRCSLFASAVLVAAAADAATISATFWSVPASTANNVPTLGNTPGPGAVLWGTFEATAINFSADAPGAYSLGGFLNSFGATTNIVYLNGATPDTSITDVLFEFTGTAQFTNGQTFSIVHDDGVNLYVNGDLVLGAPGLTPPVTSTFPYNGPTGNFGFDFIYANGPASQADFITTLVTPGTITSPSAPEPSALILLPAGLFALWFLRRRAHA